MVKKKDIAAALGISPSAVTKHAQRGMPTTSIVAARAWCDANLDPVRRVAQKLGVHAKGQREAPSASELVARANELARLADADFDRYAMPLRAALRRVPHEVRALVQLELRLWDRLIGWDRIAAWGEHLGVPIAEGAADQSEEDRQAIDDWLWALAEGSEVIGPLPGQR